MRILVAAFSLFLTVMSADSSSIGLHCWIVADDGGSTPHSLTTISNNVAELNKIYSQVGMSFSVESISYTNSTHLTRIVYTNNLHIAELCSLTNGTSGLEVYFIESITDRVAAFCGNLGIAVGANYNRTTLAHEVGHACGLKDIYHHHDEATLSVTGMPRKAWAPLDWGWYPDFVTQEVLVKRLLMYGFNTTDKGDISRGDVYGLWYRWILNGAGTEYIKDWQLSLAPVGFKTHGNRHPVSQ